MARWPDETSRAVLVSMETRSLALIEWALADRCPRYAASCSVGGTSPKPEMIRRRFHQSTQVAVALKTSMTKRSGRRREGALDQVGRTRGSVAGSVVRMLLVRLVPTRPRPRIRRATWLDPPHATCSSMMPSPVRSSEGAGSIGLPA